MYIYVDETLIIIDKPAGLLSVPGRGMEKQDCLSARIQKDYPDALTVHRLDRDTSGLIAFARGSTAQRSLSISFAERRVSKRYIAWVRGLPISCSLWNDIDLPLIADWPNRPKSKVDLERGKPSLTRWHLLLHDSVTDCTRLELAPVTGRSHQLRVHLQAIGHPIVGDPLYGDEKSRDAGQLQPASRLLLHASSLSLPHPSDGASRTFTSTPPF